MEDFAQENVQEQNIPQEEAQEQAPQNTEEAPQSAEEQAQEAQATTEPQEQYEPFQPPAQPQPFQHQPQGQQESPDVELQLLMEAVNEAKREFMQKFGKEYDELTAEPHEKLYFTKRVQQLEEQKRIQYQAIAQQQALQYGAMQFEGYLYNKYGQQAEEMVKRVSEYLKSRPAGEVDQFRASLVQALQAGDIQTAINLFEQVKAKALAPKPQSKPKNIPYSESPSVSEPEQREEIDMSAIFGDEYA